MKFFLVTLVGALFVTVFDTLIGADVMRKSVNMWQYIGHEVVILAWGATIFWALKK
jgi:hypothetical protein